MVGPLETLHWVPRDAARAKCPGRGDKPNMAPRTPAHAVSRLPAPGEPTRHAGARSTALGVGKVFVLLQRPQFSRPTRPAEKGAPRPPAERREAGRSPR